MYPRFQDNRFQRVLRKVGMTLLKDYITKDIREIEKSWK